MKRTRRENQLCNCTANHRLGKVPAYRITVDPNLTPNIAGARVRAGRAGEVARKPVKDHKRSKRVEKRRTRASCEGKQKGGRDRETNRDAAMCSESEVNQCKTSVGQSQTGKQIPCLVHTALTHTYTHMPADKPTSREATTTESKDWIVPHCWHRSASS